MGVRMRIAHMAWLGPSLLAQRRTVSGQGGSCRAGQLRVVVVGGSDLEDLGGEVGRRGSGRGGESEGVRFGSGN